MCARAKSGIGIEVEPDCLPCEIVTDYVLQYSCLLPKPVM